MIELLCVILGSAAGGAARYWVGLWVTARAGGAFPWGTLLVNVSGAWLIGLLAGVIGLYGGALQALLIFGFCGSYTTVSSFSLQTLQLVHRGRPLRAMTNVALSVAVCLVAVCAGLTVGQAVAFT